MDSDRIFDRRKRNLKSMQHGGAASALAIAPTDKRTRSVPVLSDAASSPLWMVTREPLITELVGFLDDMRKRILARPDDAHRLTFSRRRLEELRESFAATIRHGEGRLHRLGEVLCDTVYSGAYELQSMVIGAEMRGGERFTLVQRLSQDDLYAHTDLDLGTRQLRRLRFVDGDGWSAPVLIANYVEYQPNEINAHGIHKIISRIKAEEEIWNKVVDEIFNLDAVVRRDKQLRHLSRYVKDVFGLKLVVGTRAEVRMLQRTLESLRFSDDCLARRGVPNLPTTTHFDWLEVKDYMGQSGRKASGWEAVKSVVAWWGFTFEIQVQSRRSYNEERERLTRASHEGFKARREEVRDRAARMVPLFGFYRDLLRWLFLSPDAPAPTFHSVEIVVTP